MHLIAEIENVKILSFLFLFVLCMPFLEYMAKLNNLKLISINLNLNPLSYVLIIYDLTFCIFQQGATLWTRIRK